MVMNSSDCIKISVGYFVYKIQKARISKKMFTAASQITERLSTKPNSSKNRNTKKK